MSTKSTLKTEGTERAVTGSKPRNPQDPVNPVATEAVEGPNQFAEIERLRELVEGPEPLWPLPAPDTKQVKNMEYIYHV